jgi:hypothetical protein
MNVRVQPHPLTALVSDLLAVPLVQGEQGGESVQALDTALNGALKERIARSGFVGREGETVLLHTHGHLPNRAVLLL